MMQVAELTDKNGRLSYHDMVEEFQTCSVTDFLDQVQEPFLVGKELYDRFFPNVLATDEHDVSDAGACHATTLQQARTQAADQVTLTDTDSAAHAIFALRKKEFSREHASVLSIGRRETNDIVIADHSVSRVHARIIEFRGMFFLIDLESTNGTKLHHQFITPNIKVRVESDSIITFAKRDDLHARRMVLKSVADKRIVSKLFDELGPRYAERNGGYTRLIKTDPRRGDGAPMCFVELVDRPEGTRSSAVVEETEPAEDDG